MFRYIFILMFVVGMMGFSLVAFAGSFVNCTSDNLVCDVTIKCACLKQRQCTTTYKACCLP